MDNIDKCEFTFRNVAIVFAQIKDLFHLFQQLLISSQSSDHLQSRAIP